MSERLADLKEDLNAAIDEHKLSVLFSILEQICRDRSEQLYLTGDTNPAYVWQRTGRRLLELERSVGSAGL